MFLVVGIVLFCRIEILVVLILVVGRFCPQLHFVFTFFTRKVEFLHNAL